jgi:hydroxylamine dehydrogenase
MRSVHLPVILSLLSLFAAGTAFGNAAPVSDATQECLDCHAVFIPASSPTGKRAAMRGSHPRRPWPSKNATAHVQPDVPEPLLETSVGCAECHTLRGEAHADTFEHNGYDIHVVVSPDDCATCHATEREQYSKNIMAMAEKNLSENTVYADLQRNILGTG